MSLWRRVRNRLFREPKGTFNYETGEIEVREDLEGREREAGVAHEEGHMAFASRAPWWPRFVLEGSALLVSGAVVSVALSFLGLWSQDWAVRFLIPRFVGAFVVLQFVEETIAGLYALSRVPCRWTLRYVVKVGIVQVLGLVLIVMGWSW